MYTLTRKLVKEPELETYVDLIWVSSQKFQWVITFYLPEMEGLTSSTERQKGKEKSGDKTYEIP